MRTGLNEIIEHNSPPTPAPNGSGVYESISSNRIVNVDFKYRLRSVFNEGENSSSCDIEHTEFRIGSRCARTLAGPLNTPPPRPTFLLSHTLRGRHLIY